MDPWDKGSQNGIVWTISVCLISLCYLNHLHIRVLEGSRLIGSNLQGFCVAR